jgi:uncharacterized protein involved in exopolysaccharide biosynthesis
MERDPQLDRAVDPESEFSLPDLGYFLKAARRQWRVGLAAGVVVLFLGSGLALRTKNIYKSSIVAMFDRQDSLDVNLLGEIAPANMDAVEAGFDNKMVSGDFLSMLETKVELKTEGRLSKWLRSIGYYGEEAEEQRRARLVAWFSKRMFGITNPGTGILQINVMLDDTPQAAAGLATGAMDLYIRTELEAAASRLGVKVEFLKAALQQAKERLLSIQRNSGATKGRSSGDSGSLSGGNLTMKQREAELLDKIRLAESEVVDLSNERTRRRAELESELQRLGSRLQQGHPDVEAKRRELTSFMQSQSPAEIASRELTQLRRDLWMTRSQMMFPGSDGTPFMSNDERLEVMRMVSLTQKIDELSLERSRLERQIDDPGQRTRYRVIRPAVADGKPFARKRSQMAAAAIILALLAGLGAMAAREAACPLARDDWRVLRVFGRKILAQLSLQSMSGFPEISPARATELRGLLSSGDPSHRLAAKTLMSYRRLELAMGKIREGRVILFASSGASDATRQFFANFANILASDTAAKVLVIDCGLADPLIAGVSGADWIDSALGKADWKKLVIPADQERFAFDVLPTVGTLTSERMAPMTQRRAAPLLETLATHYDLILIRSFPESFFIENGALGLLSSDAIVCVDAGHTTYAELGRTLAHLDVPAMRGIVMIGT